MLPRLAAPGAPQASTPSLEASLKATCSRWSAAASLPVGLLVGLAGAAAGHEAFCSTAVQHAAGQLGMLLRLLVAGALQPATASLEAGLEAICSSASQCVICVAGLGSAERALYPAAVGAPGPALHLKSAADVPFSDFCSWHPTRRLATDPIGSRPVNAAHSCCNALRVRGAHAEAGHRVAAPFTPASSCPQPIRCCTPVSQLQIWGLPGCAGLAWPRETARPSPQVLSLHPSGQCPRLCLSLGNEVVSSGCADLGSRRQAAALRLPAQPP